MKKILQYSVVFIYLLSTNAIGQTYPSGFSQVKIVDGIPNASVFDFAPDGRIFVAQQDGVLKVIKNGILLPTPALTVDVIDLSPRQESGLVGIAVHPDFMTNHYVYLYYTVSVGTEARNKISRYTFNGDVINPASEQTILEFDLVDGKIHNGGFMKFSQGGKLFVGVGESNEGVLAQSLDSYLGKILRINADGSAPSDNPYASGSSPQSKRIWALGFRNPFTFDIDRTSGRLFVNDVGNKSFEEINDATQPGLNFGWPYKEGPAQNSTYSNPYFSYGHEELIGGCAVSGGTFFTPVATNYPSTYIGKYFYIDYCDGYIRILNPSQTTGVSASFATNIPTTSLSLKTGPDGNLYFLSRETGAMYKIVYSLNTSPLITEQPDDMIVAVTQSVHFHVSVSGVPPFTYQWKKNGVAIDGATAAEYAINNAALNDAGNYSVEVQNASGTIESNAAVLTVKNTQPPVATIITPVVGTKYKAGDVISFSGSASDPEDGSLPASAFTWYMEFWHGIGSHQHVHDEPPIKVNSTTGTFIVPIANETSADVFYRLILKVQDSEGISDTKFIDIHPVKATISLATIPAGLKVLLDNQTRMAPLSFESVAGIQRELGVYIYQNYNGVTYKFDHWSQGGSANQTIQSPSINTTYTAVYVEDTELRVPENPDNTASGLDYKYYEDEDAWVYMPDFTNLPVTETGLVEKFETTPKNRDDKYAFVFNGFIDISTDGVYKFYTKSNDGSRLFIGDRMIVENDGTHIATEKSGTIGLKQGKHAISVQYFEYTGIDELLVSYSSGGITKMEIPASRLFRATASTNNLVPNVLITSPANNLKFSTLSDITIIVNASDNDGAISKVEFYEGTNKLGEDLSAPYEYEWNNVAEGAYVLTAKAYDIEGAVATSSIVNLEVGEVEVSGIIDRVDENQGMLVYPNPSEGETITLSIPNVYLNSKGIVTILDLKGNEVYKEKITCKNCENLSINLNDKIYSGTYTIVVEMGNNKYYQKLLVK